MTTRLPTEDEALAAAAQVIAEDLQRQDERTPLEAARASLGKDATAEQLQAWVDEFRPSAARRSA